MTLAQTLTPAEPALPSYRSEAFAEDLFGSEGADAVPVHLAAVPRPLHRAGARLWIRRLLRRIWPARDKRRAQPQPVL